jgi:hypothetical protein
MWLAESGPGGDDEEVAFAPVEVLAGDDGVAVALGALVHGAAGVAMAVVDGAGRRSCMAAPVVAMMGRREGVGVVEEGAVGVGSAAGAVTRSWV